MDDDAADACGEIAATLVPDDPLYINSTWFIEGRNHPYATWDIEQLLREGALSLDTRVWSCREPGWRKLDDVWDFHKATHNRAVPPDCWAHPTMEHLASLRGWFARTHARLRAFRLRVFAPVVYRSGYRIALTKYRDTLRHSATEERERILRTWWHRAGLPAAALERQLTSDELEDFEAQERAARLPRWFRAILAGVKPYEPAPWVRLWQRVVAWTHGQKPHEYGPGGLMMLLDIQPEFLLDYEWPRVTRAWVPSGASAGSRTRAGGVTPRARVRARGARRRDGARA